MDVELVTQFRSAGFVVLCDVFDPLPLAAELTAALSDAFRGSAPANVGSGGSSFRYVPMMGERTPHSLALLDTLSELAPTMLGRAAVATRAKGTEYFGETAWHRDSDRNLDSVGFVAYLEPLHGLDGVLRVLPGSHRRDLSTIPVGVPARSATVGEVVETEPGDVIVFDEHLYHGSARGTKRHQWRVDFFADPQTAQEAAEVNAYLAGIFQVGWDGGYDIDRYPSYSQQWRTSRRRAAKRLHELGAYTLADAEENAARARRAALLDHT